MKLTTIFEGAHSLVVELQASADDASAVIPHKLEEPPAFVSLVPLDPAFYVSQWCVEEVNATAITLSKSTVAGTGAYRSQVRVQIERPHSMVA